MSAFRKAAPFVAAASLVLTACREHPVDPPPLGTMQVTIVSGDGQSGSAGQELPQPLVVRVVGSNGKGVRGQIVNFRVIAGGGHMFAGSSLTDMNGVAQDYWTLGIPGAQQVEVVAVEPTTGAKQNFGTFSATALAPAALSISPSSASFGTWPIGGTSGATVFTVQNTGDELSGTVTLSVGGANASNFSIGANACSGVALAGGATCTVSVTFSPSASGNRLASLLASASPGGSASAALSGAGALAPALSISPSSYNFGSVVVGASSGSLIFNVTNTGGAPATTVAVSVGGSNPGDFIITGTNCTGTSLNPGQTCSGAIVFAPTGAGPRVATLNATAVGGIATSAPLSGTGIAPAALTIAPTSFNYGSVAVGSSSAPQTFTVTNAGSSVTGVIAMSIGGTNPGDFTGGINTCINAILGPGQSCTAAVSFAPQAGGVRTATVTATASPGGTATASLSGTGAAAVQLSIVPASHDFGSLVVGASPRTMSFIVTNLGNTISGSLQTTLTGQAAAQFQLGSNTCSGTTLNAGASCTVTVVFDPNTAGTMSAALTVTASPGGTVSSLLMGTALPPISIDVSPQSLAFGNQAVRTTSSSQSLTVTSLWQQSQQIFFTVLGAAPQDFVVTNSCTTLAAGGSCTIGVVFSPTATGTRTATLHLTTSLGNTFDISLSGTGI